jgi:hypothetical protein
MDRHNGVVLLVCVCMLLVVVSGAVESGKVAGFNYSNFPFAFFFGKTGVQTNSTVTGGQTNSTVTGAQTSSTMTSGKKTNETPQPYYPHLILPDFLLVLPAWFLATVAIVCFGCACMLILRYRTTERVLDLEDTLQEMEQQRKYLEETWSYKLRNAALLRYYLLMRKACLRVGLRDEPAETPQEYVGRVSSFFKVEKSEAAKFASAVNRSRYGEELSELEAREASRFMGSFADVIRRRAGEGR